MSTLPPHDVPAIFWIDGAGQQQGPEPLATVIERIAHDQIPSTTPVWWQGAVNWSPFNSTPELASALDARLAPAPAPAPPVEATPFAQPAMSPFSTPAPSESATPFSSPNAFDTPAASATSVFETPATFDAPAASAPAAFAAPTSFEAPATFESPTAFEAPGTFDAPTSFEAPAPVTFDAPLAAEPAAFEQPATYEPAGFEQPATFDAPVTYDAPVAVDTTDETPVVTDVPEVIVPDEPAVAAPTLQLGDSSELAATFAQLTERAAAFDAEVARAAALDDTLAGVVRQALGELGFTIEDTQTSDDYHSFRLSEPDGATASLAIQRVPAAIDVAAAVERPVACFVDRSGRASVGLFVGDYLTEDGTDQALFTRHLASIVDAAGAAA